MIEAARYFQVFHSPPRRIQFWIATDSSNEFAGSGAASLCFDLRLVLIRSCLLRRVEPILLLH